MGKFFTNIDSSGNVREETKDIERDKQLLREKSRRQKERNIPGSGVYAGAPLFDDQVDLTYTQSTLRDQSKADKFGVISGRDRESINPVREVVTDEEGRTKFAAVNKNAEAQSIAFAANQIAQSRKLGLIGGGDASKISDPLVMRAVSRTGLPSSMNFTDKYDYGLEPGNILEASKGVAMNKEDMAVEAQRLMQGNVLPVGPGGTAKRLRQATYQPDGSFIQPRGSYVPALAEDIESVMKNMWTDTSILKDSLFQGLMDQTNDMSVVTNAFQEWVGDPKELTNDSLWLSSLLAYYRTLEEASYADYSEAEKEKYKNWALKNERMHEDLFMPKDGRNVWKPKKKVIHEKFGDYIEEVTRTNFKNSEQKEIVSNTLLDIIQNSSIRGHKSLNTFVNPDDPEGAGIDPEGFAAEFADMELIELEGKWKMIEDIKIDGSLRDFLAQSKGIRDILQPNFRNHVRVIAKNLKDRIDINAPIDGKRSSGVSPVRGNAQNIQEEMPMMLDPLGLNMIQTLYTLEEGDSGNWYEYLNSGLKVKPQHYQLMLQENDFITKNSPDGKTFYVDTKRRDSGRSGHATLLMSDMKIMRALTIPRFESFTFDVERDKKINGDEEAFLFSVMRMLGMSDYVPEAVYQQIADVMNNPDHEWRKIGRAMNQLARTGRAPARLDDQGNNNPDFITIEQLQRSGAITEGFHSLQALRALDNYITAKNNPQQKQFSTKFTTELDAAQSGPTIQGAQIGNYKALAAGGLPLFEHYYNNRTNKKSRFTLPKLYAATAGEAQGRITKLIELNEDKNFVSFVQAIFGQPDSLNNIDLKNLWNNQVGFAKTGLVGASYGQGEDGSVLAIAEKIKKHFEEDMPIADVNNIIETVNKMFGANSMYINKRSGRIEVQGEAFKQLNALAKIYTDSMFEVDPAILEYSKSMRQVYQTLVKVAKFQEDNPGVMGDFTAPQMVYMEPSSTKNVYNSSWIKGMSTSMLRENIQGEDKKFNFLNSEITYKSGSLGVDIQKEAESLVFGNARGLQSEAITRFPVVSIHGLDDLVKSITISELKRKYPDEFKFYIDVWDAGIVMPNIAGRYAEEYNKAWTSVMLNNQFFKQIVEGLDNSLASVGTLDDKRISQDLQEVIDEIDKMRRLTNDIYRTRQATDKPDLFDKRGKKELDAYMKAFGTDQIYAQENENNIARRRALASRGNPAIATVKPKGSSAQAYLDSL